MEPCNVKCISAKPESPCFCRCGGINHAGGDNFADDVEVMNMFAIGGEVADFLKKFT